MLVRFCLKEQIFSLFLFFASIVGEFQPSQYVFFIFQRGTAVFSFLEKGGQGGFIKKMALPFPAVEILIPCRENKISCRENYKPMLCFFSNGTSAF